MLAPQVGLKDILEDVRDCIAFIRTELAKYTGDGTLDCNRLAVLRCSAGGYLSLLAGLYIDPKPKVLLCLYPITDPLGEFFRTSQVHTLGDARTDAAAVEEFLDSKATVVANSTPVRESNRNKMYRYKLEKANLASLLHIKPGDPTFRVAKNVYEHGLLPTYIAHSDADVKVGID
ncbi:alpha beta-hydrolase [Fusarium albosuccineum]|uniref:Alpha beta-hydrolase n=1 Tax=Fusarium albosuccineum TaxID=1237068 RepID=A0A8H4P3X6_9HYPO|nr:alpha beta-hydrolase [Fusarium albosuccineum]